MANSITVSILSYMTHMRHFSSILPRHYQDCKMSIYICKSIAFINLLSIFRHFCYIFLHNMSGTKRIKKEDHTSEFIQSVKSHDFLYDKESDDWKNKSLKTKTWNDIATINWICLNGDVSENHLKLIFPQQIT